MKHDIKSFEAAVSDYGKRLPKNSEIVIFIDRSNKEAFYSLAPLSRAAHENGNDMCVLSVSRAAKNAIEKLWLLYDKKDKILLGFAKASRTGHLFKRSRLILEADKNGFGDLPYHSEWLIKRKEKELVKTCRLVWKEVYAPRKSEKIAMRFELVPKKEDSATPLDDYLDNFYIARTMIDATKVDLSFKTQTSRKSMHDAPERVTEMLATIGGCELSKWSGERVFKLYAKLSKIAGLSVFKPSDLVFALSGKGYYGKHEFGERVGYPIPKSTVRWNSAAGIVYKFPWLPQSPHESRAPRTRIAFTQTIPVEEYIETNLIDWKKMRKKNRVIQRILERCVKVEVKGVKVNGGRTEFTVNYLKPDGTLRGIKRSDGDARYIVDPDILKKTGKKFGMMANIPGGEAFLTPETVDGKIIGDIVIAIDDSYALSGNSPLIVEVRNNKYTFRGDKKAVIALKKQRADSLKRIRQQRSLSKEIADMKLANFDHVGEFAINTNEHAKRSRYLIVNEKMARMIHIALGSGFDPDTATEYHCDIVIDSPRQKLDVTAYNRQGKGFKIISKGKLIV